MRSLLSRLGLLYGWYGLRLATRLLLAQALVCALLLGGLIALSAWAFKQDKTAYVYDVVALRSERISRGVLIGLERAATAARRTPLSPLGATALSRQTGLSRLPRKGEYFIAKARERVLVVTAEGDEGPYATFPLPAGLLDAETSTRAWWTVGDASLLAVSPPLAGSASGGLLGSEEVSRYLASGLRNGLLTLEAPGGDRVLSGFEEVPRTNTVVFVRTSLREAFAPLRRFLGGAVVLGVAVIFAGLVLLAWVFRSLWRPVDYVAHISDRVARGDYSFEIIYGYKDEMKAIFERLARMAQMLASREAGLRRLARTIEGSLETTRAMTLEADPLRAVAQVHARLASHLRFEGEPRGYLFLLAEGAPSSVRCFPDEPLPPERAEELEALAKGLSKEVDPGTGAGVAAFLDGRPYARLTVSREGKRIVHYAGPLASGAPPAEDLFLCQSLATSMGVVLENLDLRGAAAAQARLEAEIATAEALQQNMIRVECDDPRIDVDGRCLPAARVGGDWFGVFRSRRDDCVYVYVADVSGHGVDSSLFSAAACGVMQSLLGLVDAGALPELAVPSRERLPAIARRVNANLVTIGRKRYAMTLALACVEPASRTLTWISCGHTAPWFVSAGSADPRSLPSRGSLLGISDTVEFEVKSRAFSEGDALFLYTDGLLENAGENGKPLSPRALRKALEGLRGRGAREGLESLLAFQSGFIGGAAPADDTTCVVVRLRKGGSGSEGGSLKVSETGAGETCVGEADVGETCVGEADVGETCVGETGVGEAS